MLKVFTIFILSLLMQSSLLSQQYWIKETSPTDKNLSSCFFTDSLNGWIAGDSGLIIHTTDKGHSWIFQNSGVQNEIKNLFFLNANVGYALSLDFNFTPPGYPGTRILSTTNGGNTWNNYLFPDTNLFFNTIYFLDQQNGFLGGTSGKLFYTTDSGNNWIAGIVDSGLSFGFPVEKIKFYNADIGFASGGAFDIAGAMWTTTNGGKNWKTKIVGAEPVYDFHIFDSLNVLGVGGDFEYGVSNVITYNGGGSWTYTELGVFGIANSIVSRTYNELWASLGIVDSLLVSTNSGNNWKLTGTPNGSGINDMFFVDSRNGWAVGKNGTILKYNSNLIGIHENNNYSPEAFTLYQNFPNPFNPSTVIRYDLKVNSNVSLMIYDITGKQVAELVNQKQNSGIYELTFDASNFQSGIYFYRIKVTNLASKEAYTLSRKMIILK